MRPRRMSVVAACQPVPARQSAGVEHGHSHAAGQEIEGVTDLYPVPFLPTPVPPHPNQPAKRRAARRARHPAPPPCPAGPQTVPVQTFAGSGVRPPCTPLPAAAPRVLPPRVARGPGQATRRILMATAAKACLPLRGLHGRMVRAAYSSRNSRFFATATRAARYRMCRRPGRPRLEIMLWPFLWPELCSTRLYPQSFLCFQFLNLRRSPPRPEQWLPPRGQPQECS